MSKEPTSTYTTRVSGLWSSRHELWKEEERQGLLTMERNWHGMVTAGEYRPEKGEVLIFRRDPGLVRSQFSMWTEEREWLGSSLRWNPVQRTVQLSTGGKPYTLLPCPGLVRGWILQAPKTGLSARFEAGLIGRDSKLEVFRRLEFPLLLFAYFLGSQIYLESLLPGPTLEHFPA